MDGLSKIIDRIISDNDAECGAMREKAREKAKEIIDEAKFSASAATEKILSENEQKIQLIISKAHSGSLLEYKREILAAKGKIISEALENALDCLCNLDENEYFSNIKTLAVKNALSGKGEIVFCSKDKSRIPDGFVDTLNKELDAGKSLVLSEKTVDCRGGFVIEYPEMTCDCRFEALLEDNADEIKDELGAILFS